MRKKKKNVWVLIYKYATFYVKLTKGTLCTQKQYDILLTYQSTKSSNTPALVFFCQ